MLNNSLKNKSKAPIKKKKISHPTNLKRQNSISKEKFKISKSKASPIKHPNLSSSRTKKKSSLISYHSY